MVLAFTNINFIPGSGFLDLLFHQTWFSLQILGLFNPPFTINLIQLIIVLIIALAVNAIAERLTSKKMGGLAVAVLITLIGSFVATRMINLPFDFAVEGVRIIAALIGATIIGVFYTLIRAQFGSGKGGGH